MKCVCRVQAGEQSPYFRNTARTLLAVVVMVLIRRAPGQWDLRDLLLIMSDLELLRHVLSLEPWARRLLVHLKVKTTAHNVLSTADEALSDYEIVAALWAAAPRNRRFTLEGFFDAEECLLLGHSDRLAAALVPLISLLLRTAFEIALTRNDPTQATLVGMDEYQLLQGVDDALKAVADKGRSAGLIPVVAFPSWSSLVDSLRGNEHRARALWNLLDNKALFAAEMEDGERASMAIGEAEYVEVTDSDGWSTSESNSGPWRTIFSLINWRTTRQWQSGVTTSSNQTEHVVTRRLVTRDEIAGLPVATWNEGVARAFFKSAFNDRFFFAEVPFRKMLEPVYAAASATITPRPSRDEWLAPWTESDALRLNL